MVLEKILGHRWVVLVKTEGKIVQRVLRAKTKEQAIKKAKKIGELLEIEKLKKGEKVIEFEYEILRIGG